MNDGETVLSKNDDDRRRSCLVSNLLLFCLDLSGSGSSSGSSSADEDDGLSTSGSHSDELSVALLESVA